MYLKELTFSTGMYLIKLITDYLFYIGGAIMGFFFYLTGLSVAQLQSIFIVIFIDIATRVWAERVNHRKILSRKMFAGFTGKIASYMILFILAQHSFVFKETIQFVILGGFSLIEFRSVYENLLDAKQKHIKFIGDRINVELEKFFPKETNKQDDPFNR